ncbi:MAG: DUF4011 domain-containing protein [Deltaproteobacteria bacterium]|nr:DUF4011 domain-containing protein [Deltaproteobacteria bacterium]
MPDSIAFVEALTQARDKLLDTSARNRLLNYRKSTARSITIVDESLDQVFKTLVGEGKDIDIIPLIPAPSDNKLTGEGERSLYSVKTNRLNPALPIIDLGPEFPSSGKKTDEKDNDGHLQALETPERLERLCAKLKQDARNAIEETGCNMLHLAIGFLEWFESPVSEESRRAPLILVPVQIKKDKLDKQTQTFSYKLAYTQEDLENNLSLAQKLDSDWGINLPELKDNFTPESYLEEVGQRLGNIHRWRIISEMAIDLFSFAKIAMFKDLDDSRWPDGSKLINNLSLNQILVGVETKDTSTELSFGEEYHIDLDGRARQTTLILPADSSQHSAIIDALFTQGNLVIEGPPGTGKSQTISNLIAAALDQGKTVLFVAEKMAALEVVRKRLDDVGLGDFCLELHSHKTQKGKLHEDVKKRINTTYHDAHSLDLTLRDLETERRKLMAYSDILKQKVGPRGEQICELFWVTERWRLQGSEGSHLFRIDNVNNLQWDAINPNASTLHDMARLRGELSNQAIESWKGFQAVKIYSKDKNEVQENFTEIYEVTNEVMNQINVMNIEHQMPVEGTLAQLKNLIKTCNEVFNDIPDGYISELGKIFLDTQSIKLLEYVNTEINKFREFSKQAFYILPRRNTVPLETLRNLFDLLARLEDAGINDITFQDIQERHDALLICAKDILELEDKSPHLTRFFACPTPSIREFGMAVSVSGHLRNIPSDITWISYPNLCEDRTSEVYERAKKTFEILSSRVNTLYCYFSKSLIPAPEELKQNLMKLRQLRQSFLRFLKPSYWKLKSVVAAYLAHDVKFDANEVCARIEDALELFDEINRYDCSKEYQSLLGPNFSGMKTNWNNLEAGVLWCQKLTEIMKSSSRAIKIMSKVFDDREKIIGLGMELRKILERLTYSTKKAHEPFKAEDSPNTVLIDIASREREFREVLNQVKQLGISFDRTILELKASLKAHFSSTDVAKKISEDRSIGDLNRQLTHALGSSYKGLGVDIQKFLAVANWVQRVVESGNCTNELVRWIVEKNTVDRITLLRDVVGLSKTFIPRFDAFVRSLEAYGRVDFQLFFGAEYDACSLEAIADKIGGCLHNFPYLVTWSDYCRHCDQALDAGLAQFVKAIDHGDLSAKNTRPSYLFAVYNCIVRELLTAHPLLNNFTRTGYENIVKCFSNLDQDILKNVHKRISHKASQRPVPAGVGTGPVGNHTEKALIDREISKIKRHIPIRQLVRRAGRALQTLKPCFMMSPLSVAQYLDPGSIHFDLVVMDEASQLKPEDALGAIARGAKLIVVGDPKQLPPTSFFDRADRTNDDEDLIYAVSEAESILERCIQVYPARRLRWHYRSEHDSLIKFSNHTFYSDRPLYVFPSPCNSNRGYGVKFNYIQGAKYHQGTNLVEAQAVVKAVEHHAKHFSNVSLGVATFNLKQAEIILDLLESKQKENPLLEKWIRESTEKVEPFFVKNLESVQGDERDVIFISVTYGPDQATGKVFQRVGPINTANGWRRLNVIFTRAKQRVELFSSIRSSDVLLPQTASRGVTALKAYLEFAETGFLPDYGITTPGAEPQSPFEVSVIEILKQYGYQTSPQVGVAGFAIDIGVHHPDCENDFVLGIECDGATYHSAKSVRDRDRLRQEILEKKGWKIHRIWSVDWFKNRDNEINRLLTVVQKAIKGYAPSTSGPFQQSTSGRLSPNRMSN